MWIRYVRCVDKKCWVCVIFITWVPPHVIQFSRYSAILGVGWKLLMSGVFYAFLTTHSNLKMIGEIMGMELSFLNPWVLYLLCTKV